MSERSVKVRLTGDVSDFNRALLGASATAKAFSKELDTGTDRATMLTQSILAIAPAAIPIGAAAIPAISGLTNQMAFAAAGAGVMVLAFNGVGDALKSVNDYQLEPTTANFEKMQETLRTLGPAGRDLVLFLQELRPELQGLQNAAQAGLFPGVEDGLRDLTALLPQAERIVSQVAGGLGQVIAEAGDNLNDPRWAEFFTFLETEAKPTLIDMGRTFGNFAEGFANLWMAFDPLSDQFSHSFLELSRDFAKWTDGLDQTEGFQEFLDYVSRVGPKVWDTLGAVADALLQIVEAAAPIGEATLPVIESLAKAIGAVADSDLGPVIIGVVSLTSALSRMKALGMAANSSALGGLLGKSAFAGGLSNIKAVTSASDELRIAQSKLADNPGMQGLTVYRENLKGVAGAEKALGETTKARNAQIRAAAVGVGTMAFALSDLDNKLGLTNAAMGAMVGSAFGPWGAALGGGIGLVKDFAAANGDAAEKIQQLGNDVAAAGTKNLDKQHDAYITAVALAEKAGGDPKLMAEADRVGDIWWRNAKAAEAAEKASDDARFAQAGLGDSMAYSSEQTRRDTIAMLDNIKAKNGVADAAENAFSAETNYRQALKDAQKQAATNSAGIEGSSDAALKNRGALDQLANAWNRVADSGDASVKDMRKARASFIDAAEGMGVSRKAAEALSRELFHIPSPHPKIVLEGINGALDRIQHIKDRLLSLDGTTARTFVQIKESVGKKDGGLVQRYDSGGFVSGPGGPRDDLIDARLSNGEFVVNAAATARNLGLLHSINAQRYAGGGFVQPTGASVSSSGGTGVMSVDLRGARVGLDKDGFATFVDGRIDIGISQNNDYRGN